MLIFFYAPSSSVVVSAGSVGVSIDTGAIAARSSEDSSSTGTAPETAGRAAAAGDAPSVAPTTGTATFRRFSLGARAFAAHAAPRHDS